MKHAPTGACALALSAYATVAAGLDRSRQSVDAVFADPGSADLSFGLGSDLVNLDDGKRYTLGLGRAFDRNLVGSLTLSHEPFLDWETVSPIGPTEGLFAIALGGRYTDGAMRISGGINPAWLGDATTGVADRPVASFEDNHAVGVGLQASLTF